MTRGGRFAGDAFADCEADVGTFAVGLERNGAVIASGGFFQWRRFSFRR